MSYAYDVNGIRASKTVDGVKHTYVYDGTQLLAERYGTTRLEFMYNESGQPHLVRYSTNSGSSYVTYYYILNQQGDVMALMDTAGELAVKYTYDPWGKVLTVTNGSGTAITSATHIANVNPIRYRSYYYDTDTQLYYLQSRYYDPEVSRFINADAAEFATLSTVSLSDTNLFAYCANDPVNKADPSGEVWHIVIGAVLGGIVSGISTMAANYMQGNNLTDGLGMSMLTGAASGALAATGVGVVGAVLGNAAISMAGNAVEQVATKNGFDNFNVGEMLFDGVVGGVTGAIGGKGNGSKHLMNLGVQSIRRTSNAIVHGGIKEGVRTAAKAVAYYVKNTKSYYSGVVKGLLKDAIVSLGSAFITSKIGKKYIRTAIN